MKKTKMNPIQGIEKCVMHQPTPW